MTRKIIYASLLVVFGLAACSKNKQESDQGLTRYVDPYIGTAGHGHVFLGANVPFGFVQLGPSQLTHGWDWCSGYHYSDSTIVGFGHQHLSGTGIGDLGDISLMPVLGDVKTTKGSLPDPASGIYSFFSHSNEQVKPGYYSVLLDRFGIQAELTATTRAGMHRYRFPASGQAKVVIDLEHGIGWDTPVEGFIRQENDTVVSGYRKSTGWAVNQQVYFTARFSKPMKAFIVSDSTEVKQGNELSGQRAYGQAVFDTREGEQLLVKVALSAVSIENAKLNMEAELPHWNFDQTVQEADQAWNRQLEKLKVESLSESDKQVFYTALYHTMIAPSVFSDVNGDYRGADGQVYSDPEHTTYTTFSLWDTYRAAQPLMTILHPEKLNDIGNTFLQIYAQQGKLPVWHLMGNETDCMIGNPGIPVLADIVLKSDGIDKKKAFEAMRTSAMLDERGLNWLKEYGYIPYDKEETFETVAKGLEYALADWSMAQVARRLQLDQEYDFFYNRSQSYRHYFDADTRFMRGKSSDGKFREPFNPFHSTHREDDYAEGNAWQYVWLVPQDVRGLIELFGGEEPFVAKLDSLFVVEGDMGVEASPDISGLIGQYAHGNEPGHHTPYLYVYAGQPGKTAEMVRRIMTEFYTIGPEGLCGNEDVGQMSAWYVMSALGFYQVAPAGGVYVLGSPMVKEACLKVGEGKTFTVIARNNSPENIYIQGVKLNGQPYDKSYITHADIVAGGILELEMGHTPSATYGLAKESRP